MLVVCTIITKIISLLWPDLENQVNRATTNNYFHYELICGQFFSISLWNVKYAIHNLRGQGDISKHNHLLLTYFQFRRKHLVIEGSGITTTHWCLCSHTGQYSSESSSFSEIYISTSIEGCSTNLLLPRLLVDIFSPQRLFQKYRWKKYIFSYSCVIFLGKYEAKSIFQI